MLSPCILQTAVLKKEDYQNKVVSSLSFKTNTLASLIKIFIHNSVVLILLLSTGATGINKTLQFLSALKSELKCFCIPVTSTCELV